MRRSGIQGSFAAGGVTGMLFYGNGTFLQVIEGEATTVDELVGKIARDPRHEDIRILSRKAIEHREHPDWSMGFEQVTAVRTRGVDPKAERDRMLNLLQIAPLDGGVELVCAGGVTIRLDVQRLACHVEDLGEPWPTVFRPTHEV